MEQNINSNELINLELEVNQQMMYNLNVLKEHIQKQTVTIEKHLLNKLVERFSSVDETKLKEILTNNFTNKIVDELNSLISYYQMTEIEYYGKEMHTADLIFNTLDNKRNQVIYLNKIIKNISERNNKLENIFTESSKNKISSIKKNDGLDEENVEENLSFDDILNHFCEMIINNPQLSVDESHLIKGDFNHYFELYKDSIILGLEKMLDSNKSLVITRISKKMDEKDLRNGKTNEIAEKENKIINDALKKVELMLADTISKHKITTREDLKTCSVVMANVILISLPEGYQNQRGLVEIIVDSNIDRLDNLLDEETKRLADNLQSKNENIIKNELYEEKRYRQIKSYECDFELVDRVYQDVLEEISRAYDYNLLGLNKQFEELQETVLKESVSTKNVFKNIIGNITVDNLRNLNSVVIEMHQLSEKVNSENQNNVQNTTKGM